MCVAWASLVRLLEGNPFSPPHVLIKKKKSSGQFFSGSLEFRNPCQRSVPSGSLGQHHSCVLYHFPRRDALSFSVSSDIRALGVVSSKGHPSLKIRYGRPLSGGGQFGSRLLIQGRNFSRQTGL